MSIRVHMVTLVASSLLFGSLAGASLSPDSSGTDPLSYSNALSQNVASSGQVLADQWYELQKTTLVRPMTRDGVAENVNVPDHTLVLPAGLEVSVLELSPDGAYALIGMDDEALAEDNSGIEPGAPSLAWVAVADLLHGAPSEVNVAEADSINDSIASNEADEYIDTDFAKSHGKTSARKRAGHRAKGKHGGKPMTYCLRDVAIAAARFTSTKHIPRGKAIPRLAAAEAYGPFMRAGWHPIHYSPSNPLGTACFFGHGRKDCSGGWCGHAAIKVGPNAWKGAGTRPTPFISGRTLIGCLTPP